MTNSGPTGMLTTVISPVKWERIQQIFEEASRLPPGRRREWVSEACHGDRKLYLQVESLLLSLEEENRLLEQHIASHVSVGAATQPERIGPYRIISQIGRGGMGTVYLAERADEQYRRQVAIKIIHSFAALHSELLLRFRVERQILADLQHPNIAVGVLRLSSSAGTDCREQFAVQARETIYDFVPVRAIHRFHEFGRLAVLHERGPRELEHRIFL